MAVRRIEDASQRGRRLEQREPNCAVLRVERSTTHLKRLAPPRGRLGRGLRTTQRVLGKIRRARGGPRQRPLTARQTMGRRGRRRVERFRPPLLTGAGRQVGQQRNHILGRSSGLATVSTSRERRWWAGLRYPTGPVIHALRRARGTTNDTSASHTSRLTLELRMTDLMRAAGSTDLPHPLRIAPRFEKLRQLRGATGNLRHTTLTIGASGTGARVFTIRTLIAI